MGAVVGGIGAVINKGPEEKFHHVLLKGIGEDALGGYVVFESKRLVKQFSMRENYMYVWPSKIVNSIENLIIENLSFTALLKILRKIREL